MIYWGKILRSKDNSLNKELILKNIDYAIPSTFLREKPQDYWTQKIQRDFDKNNLKEISIEEAQEKFLNLFAQYNLAYSSYYVLRASGHGEGVKKIDSAEIDEENTSDNANRGEVNKDTFLYMCFLASHMNHDLLCVINYNGISFFENQKRDKVIQRITFDELFYAMGSGDVLKLGYIARNQAKIHDAKIELYAQGGQGARPIAEDIIAYCQIKLAECTRNDFIDIVKRNITNLFEDVEDPFADDFDTGSPSGFGLTGPGNLKQKFNPFGSVKPQKIQANDPRKRSSILTPGQDFDFFVDNGDGGSNLITPTNEGNHQNSIVRQAVAKSLNQRGNQFRLRDKQFLVYLRKFPLHSQKTIELGAQSLNSARNSEVSTSKTLNQAKCK